MGWERKRGKLQELNRLLRGATDTTYRHEHGQLALGAGRRALRAHARCRHAAAARGAAPAHRQDGASAQPPALRCASAAAWSRATPSCSRASRSRCRRAREAIAVPARVLRRRRRRSLRRRRLRRLPGPVRRRLVRRQGHLRHRRLRGRARRPRARKHAAEPRPVRRHLRARRPRLRRRSGRGISRRATTSPRCASTAGCAATGSCCRGFSGGATSAPPNTAAATAACRSSACGRCSTTCAARCRRRRRRGAGRWAGRCRSASRCAWCAFILLALALPTLLPLFAAILPRRSTVTLRSHLRALRLDFSVALAQTALLDQHAGATRRGSCATPSAARCGACS